ncbi:MAG: hypothetical protein AB7U73_09725 [Pirellulales bacterium]
MARHGTVWQRASAGALAAITATLFMSTIGCGGPRIPPEQLGEVLQELPKLPEAEKPYEHPELVADGLDVPAAKSKATPVETPPGNLESAGAPSDETPEPVETNPPPGDEP